MTSSSGNAQKTPLARALERFTSRAVQSLLDLTGMSLPCSVTAVGSSGIVTIKFEITGIPFTPPQITVPVLAFEYVRYPIQVGCKGMVISADAYLGGMSGLGGGTADLTQRPNLSNLAFLPTGSKAWSAPEDPNAVIVYGPNGVILRDAESHAVLKIGPTVVSLTLPAGVPFIINGNVQLNGGLAMSGNITAIDGLSVYAGNIATSGTITEGVGTGNQVGVGTHKHADVATGSGESGGPVPGT